MLVSNDPELLRVKEVTMSFGSLLALTAGEEGRGRQKMIIPVKAAAAKPGEILDGGSVSIGTTTTGRPCVVAGDTGRWAILSSEGGYTRRGDGWFKYDDSKFKMLSEGNGADGLAGRIGSWKVGLFELPTTTGYLRIRLSGGMRGSELLVVEGPLIKVIKEDEIDAFFEGMSRGIPEEVSHLWE